MTTPMTHGVQMTSTDSKFASSNAGDSAKYWTTAAPTEARSMASIARAPRRNGAQAPTV